MSDRRLPLKLCPCCGGEATVVKQSGRSVLHTSYWSGYAKCKTCKLMTPMCKSPGAVERIWNRRPEHEVESRAFAAKEKR